MKHKRHPKSLLKDGVSDLRLVPTPESIFSIIMLWRQEQEDEEKKKQKKTETKANALKQASLQAWVKTKPAPAKDKQSGTVGVTREELKYQEQKFGNEEDDEDMSKVSKVIKVKEVQSVRLTDYVDKDARVQAILINPKWKIDHSYAHLYSTSQDSTKSGGTQEETKLQGEDDSQMKEKEEDDSSDSDDDKSKANNQVSSNLLNLLNWCFSLS